MPHHTRFEPRWDVARRPWVAALALGCLLGACGFEPDPLPASFALAPATLAATEGAPQARGDLEKLLVATFGTPAEPRFASNAAWPELAGSALAPGVRPYQLECQHCHGPEGGGDGSSSFGLSPRPRDFRLGVFKYTALKDQSRPRREDLLHTLEQGVPGTSMPPFQRLDPSAREALADHVRFLAVRGEVEALLLASWKEEGRLDQEALDEAARIVWSRWQRAPEKLLVIPGELPAASPERLARGDALYHDPLRGNCASCHGAEGAGDGPAAWKIGVDGKRAPAYLDAWGQPIVPRDLRQGQFHGGSRPVDLYRRIACGIPGGPMPAMGEARNQQGELLLSPDDIWSLVHYVRSLSGLSDGS